MNRPDFIHPKQRVPREPSVAPSLHAQLMAIILLAVVLWALPDLAAWFSSWSACR